MDQLDIVLTKQDTEDLHFPHDDTLTVKLTIAKWFLKRILIDTRSSMNIIFLSTLK